MPIRKVPDTDLHYFLVVFDEKGNERREPDGTLLSDTLRGRLKDPAAPITDLFFVSHGWKGDIPAAIDAVHCDGDTQITPALAANS